MIIDDTRIIIVVKGIKGIIRAVVKHMAGIINIRERQKHYLNCNIAKIDHKADLESWPKQASN